MLPNTVDTTASRGFAGGREASLLADPCQRFGCQYHGMCFGVSGLYQPGGPLLSIILIGEFFFQIFDIFCFAQFFHLPYFPDFFFPNIGMLTNLIFLLLENFTNSDRTPPYIDTHLQLFPNFGIFGKNALR